MRSGKGTPMLSHLGHNTVYKYPCFTHQNNSIPKFKNLSNRTKSNYVYEHKAISNELSESQKLKRDQDAEQYLIKRCEQIAAEAEQAYQTRSK